MHRAEMKVQEKSCAHILGLNSNAKKTKAEECIYQLHLMTGTKRVNASGNSCFSVAVGANKRHKNDLHTTGRGGREQVSAEMARASEALFAYFLEE